jgi:hypothetical protein
MSTGYVALLCLLAAAPAALAQGPRAGAGYGPSVVTYTWAEARLLLLDPDGGGDADGIRFAGSGRIQDNLFATGGLTMIDADGGGDSDAVDLGLGLRVPLSPTVDFVGIGGIVYVDVDNRGRGRGDSDDLGPALTGGVRAEVLPQLELAAYAGYAEVFGDGDVTFTGEAIYYATPNLGFLGALTLSDDVDGIHLGARWSFVPAF